MTLGDIPRQIRQLWITRFDFLAELLPGRMAPSDIDQVIERRGSFLFIECKRPYQSMPKGQEILLGRLAKLPGCRVMLVVGHPPDRIERWGWWGGSLQEGDAHQVREEVLKWFNAASEGRVL